jgi:iron complex transport system substrate-binding protein
LRRTETDPAARHGRRWALRTVGVLAAAPLVAAGALRRGVHAALVGAQDFADSQIEPGPFPKPLRGPAGAVQTMARSPRRIVSTYLGADELLASLVSPERVVAVSAYADDPATSNCHGVYPKAVPRLRTEPERILSLEPDLVCVAGYTEPEALRLTVGTGLAVVRWSRFTSFTDIVAMMRLHGAAVGEETRAAALVAELERLLGDLASRLAGVRPVRVLYYDPPTYTFGRGSLVGEILARAGGDNVAEQLGIVGPGQIELETVLGLEPEAIVMPRYADNGSRMDELASNSIWRQVPAVRAGRVHEIPGSWVATVSHHAARGLARIARLLHPSRFG